MLVQEFGIPFPTDTIQRQLTININHGCPSLIILLINHLIAQLP